MKAQVETLLNDALAQRTDLFLIHWDIGVDNHIKIVIDGDQGVRVQDCIEVSRAVEHNLDRESWDFSIEFCLRDWLNLWLWHQYKNIGHWLK